MTAENDLARAAEQATEAMNQFANGNPGPWKQLCSQHEDATLFGGWGGHERGWDQLEPRYEWASLRFAAADMTYENISTVVTADLGYTVGIEHYLARLAGQDVTVPVVLRVTHIFRREDGGWKIVHRHADPIMSKQETASVIQR